MKRLEEEWTQYQNSTVPPDIAYLQVREIRRAFYAGSLGVLSLVMARFAAGDEVSMQDLAFMDSINQEIREFVRTVESGLA